MSKVCVFFGTGYEEIEALAVVDILRRQGIDTQMVSVMNDKTVTGSHQIPVVMDALLEDVDFDNVDLSSSFLEQKLFSNLLYVMKILLPEGEWDVLLNLPL